jgi:hypothetical protein
MKTTVGAYASAAKKKKTKKQALRMYSMLIKVNRWLQPCRVSLTFTTSPSFWLF